MYDLDKIKNSSNGKNGIYYFFGDSFNMKELKIKWSYDRHREYMSRSLELGRNARTRRSIGMSAEPLNEGLTKVRMLNRYLAKRWQQT